ncbi:ANTAR domain-containing protein [Streptomyces sp. JNUCC 63]
MVVSLATVDPRPYPAHRAPDVRVRAVRTTDDLAGIALRSDLFALPNRRPSRRGAPGGEAFRATSGSPLIATPGTPGRPHPTNGRTNPGKNVEPSEIERLRTENRQLEYALVSHAVVDQAIGALVAMGGIDRGEGFAVLREVSQHTNTKLSAVAEHVLKHAQGAALPDVVEGELCEALARHGALRSI